MQGAILYFVVFGWTWTVYLVTSLFQELDATIFVELRKLDVVFKYTMFTSALCLLVFETIVEVHEQRASPFVWVCL